MNRPRFGIISGAGPMAGATLYQTIIQELQKKGAYQDADFPDILLSNVPFADMLDGQANNILVSQQLEDALERLAPWVDYTYIACQTLHLFLSEEHLNSLKVVSLLNLIKLHLESHNKPLAIAASITSAQNKLHSQTLGDQCYYIEKEKAQHAIIEILKGNKPDMSWLHQISLNEPVLLGCTEYSVLHKDCSWNIIDPVKLAARDIIKRFTH